MKKIKIWFKLELTSESSDGQIKSICLRDLADRDIYIEIVKDHCSVQSRYKVLLKTIEEAKDCILEFLDRYEGYKIQFFGDQCSIQWYHLFQLITEWETIEEDITDRVRNISPLTELLKSQMEVLIEAKGRTIYTREDRVYLVTKTKVRESRRYTILNPIDRFSFINNKGVS